MDELTVARAAWGILKKFLAYIGVELTTSSGRTSASALTERSAANRLSYGAFRRSASEFLSPPSMRIWMAATVTITAAVTKCTTASVVLLGKVKK